MKKLFITTLLLFSINSFALSVPPLTGPVVDNANVLSNESQLESSIRALYNNGQGPQVNVLTISSLNGDNLEQYAHKVFTTWKLGDAKRDDGVLFLIVINDRKMRIEVGQGLEGGLTDLQSKRILGSLKSYFRSQDYNGGIQAGLTQIIDTVSKPNAVQQPTSPQSVPTKNVSKPANDDGGLMASILFSTIIALIGFLVIGRIITNYKRNYKAKFEYEQKNLDNLMSQEAKSLSMAKKYKDKIESAEKTHNLSLSEATNKIKKEIKSTISDSEQKENTILSLNRQVIDCPIAKLESLKRTKTSLNHDLRVSQQAIIQYQNLINKEGK